MTTLSTSPMTSLMQKDIKSQVNSNQQTENTHEQNINDSMKAMAQSNGGLNTLAAMGKKLQEVEAKNAEEKKTEAELAANSSSSTNTQSTLTTSTSLSMPLIGQNTSSSTSKNVNQSPQTVSTPKTNSSPSAASLNTSAGDDDSNKAKKTLGSMNNSSSHKIDQRDLPKAMVKPNVLTHVIEGFVIQEASEPFPVTRQRYSEKENDEPPSKFHLP